MQAPVVEPGAPQRPSLLPLSSYPRADPAPHVVKGRVNAGKYGGETRQRVGVVDPQSGTVIGAMALGPPIVASDIPAMREVLEPGENSVSVPPGVPEALVDAVERFLGDSARMERFRKRSPRRFEDRLTLDRAVDRMGAL